MAEQSLFRLAPSVFAGGQVVGFHGELPVAHLGSALPVGEDPGEGPDVAAERIEAWTRLPDAERP